MGKELHDLFAIGGLKIFQDQNHLAFSIDSVLLADFIKVNPRWKNIMDFGTGFGPIPLFLSLKTKAKIVGIDIDENVIQFADESIRLNHLEDQISVILMNVNEVHQHYQPGSFDLVTCNPPFFKVTDKKVLNLSESYTNARHETTLSLESFIISAKKILSTGGSLSFVHRPDRLEEIILTLNKHHFHVKRMQYVYPLPGKKAIMVLIDARANANIGSLELLEPIYIMEQPGIYSQIVKDIFYNQRS